MIIRLIDVVLIVLFGFLLISDIDIKGTLKLPAPVAGDSMQKEKKMPVYVDIGPENRFFVSRTGETTRRADGPARLESMLLSMKQRIAEQTGLDMAVIIRPHAESRVQATVDVLDLCDRNGFPRNIARRSMTLF